MREIRNPEKACVTVLSMRGCKDKSHVFSSVLAGFELRGLGEAADEGDFGIISGCRGAEGTRRGRGRGAEVGGETGEAEHGEKGWLMELELVTGVAIQTDDMRRNWEWMVDSLKYSCAAV